MCENNEYAQYMHWSDTMVFDNIAALASDYHMEGVQLDGNDVRLVHTTVSAAAARARAGEGPTLIELKTQRFHGHSSGDPQVYRSKASVGELRRTRDPIARLEGELIAAGLLTHRDALVAEIEAEVAQAVQFAQDSPYPADEELTQHVYA